MGRIPTGNPDGRPERDFDKSTFEGLCHVWCTWGEMENILKTDKRTMEKWCQREYGMSFSDAYDHFSAGGKASLRRSQFQLSKKNAQMAIWLGKQMLGQRDIPKEVEEFNGKLAELLEKLHIENPNDLIDKQDKKTEKE